MVSVSQQRSAKQITPPHRSEPEQSAIESEAKNPGSSTLVFERRIFLCVIPTGVCGVEGPRLPAARTCTAPKKKNCSDGVLPHLYLSEERACPELCRRVGAMFIATGEVQRRHTRDAYSCTQTIAIGLRDTSQYLGSLLCVIPTGVCRAEGPRLPTARTGTAPKRESVATASFFTSTCPRRGRRDSYRDGRGSTPAHPPSFFLHSGSRVCVA
jgi:hypothetical protein